MVIYNPLPRIPPIQKRPSDTPSLLYAGGDSYIKGFHILLNVLPRILRGNVNLQVIINRQSTLDKLRRIAVKTQEN